MWLWLPYLSPFLLPSFPLQFATTNSTNPTLKTPLFMSPVSQFHLPPPKPKPLPTLLSKNDTGNKVSFLVLPKPRYPTLRGRPPLRISRRSWTKRTMPRRGSTLSLNPYLNASTRNSGFKPSRFLSHFIIFTIKFNTFICT